jgi:hypothetical protein
VSDSVDVSTDIEAHSSQSINQHNPGCTTDQLPLDRCLRCGPQATLHDSHPFDNIFDAQPWQAGHSDGRRTYTTYAQVVEGYPYSPEVATPVQIHTQPPLAFPSLGAGCDIAPTSTNANKRVQTFTYAEAARSGDHNTVQQRHVPEGQSYRSYPPLSMNRLSNPNEQITAYSASSSESMQPKNNGTRGTMSRRGSHIRRRPSRPYHTPVTNDPLQDLVDLQTSLLQPEINSDPRNVSTFVQRTRFGGHRGIEPQTTDMIEPSPPAAPATLSASSSRSRRKGEAMRDPALPYTCQVCGSTFRNQGDHKYVFNANPKCLRLHLNTIISKHVKRTHGDDKPHQCQECGKGFLFPKDVRRHTPIHNVTETRERIPCPYGCGKSFTRQDNLNRHLRDHGRADSANASSRSTSRHGSFSSQQQWQSF